MPIISITASLPSEGHDPSHCDDFLGLTLEADDITLDAALDPHPDLPRFFGYYGIAMEKVVQALNQRGKEQAVVYWERAMNGPVLWIPYDCAQVLD